jgi:uncharacterized DUF497 family protein
MGYGEERWISLGVIENECFIVVHTERKDVTRPIAAWKGGRVEHDQYQASITRTHQEDDGGR